MHNLNYFTTNDASNLVHNSVLKYISRGILTSEVCMMAVIHNSVFAPSIIGIKCKTTIVQPSCPTLLPQTYLLWLLRLFQSLLFLYIMTFCTCPSIFVYFYNLLTLMPFQLLTNLAINSKKTENTAFHGYKILFHRLRYIVQLLWSYKVSSLATIKYFPSPKIS